jgi:serine/threonine protein kinase
VIQGNGLSAVDKVKLKDSNAAFAVKQILAEYGYERLCFFRELLLHLHCSCSVVLPLTTFGVRYNKDIYDKFTAPTLVLVTPFQSGSTLFVHLKSRSRGFSPLMQNRLAFSTIAGIYFCHRCGIQHRDIKAENYLVTTSDGSADIKDENVSTYLMDLGFAKCVGPGGLERSMDFGTAAYKAPELVTRWGVPTKTVDTMASDIYSYAMIVYWLLEGKPPWDRDYNNRGKIWPLVQGGQRPDISDEHRRNEKFKQIVTFLNGAWDNIPGRRPTAAEIFHWFVSGGLRFPGLSKAEEANLDAFMKKTAIEIQNRETAIRSQREVIYEFRSFPCQSGVLLGGSPAQIARIIEQAKEGLTDARCLLGVLYHRGIIVDRDDARALKWLNRAATEESDRIVREIKSANGHYERGCVFEADRKWDEAAREYLQGIREKNRECVTQLGKMMVHRGDEASIARGLEYLGIGEKMGDKKAVFLIARHLYKAEKLDEAIAKMEQANVLGHQLAQNFLTEWIRPAAAV